MSPLLPYAKLLCVSVFLTTSVIIASAQDSSPGKDQPKEGTTQSAAALKQPVAKDIVQSAVWDGRKVMPFKAIDNPAAVKAADADFMSDDDYVLGVTVNGQSRAYPTRYVWFHHAVNDTFKRADGEPTHVAITYCSVCNTGIRYDPVVNGRLAKFDFYGLYNGIVALCDRETEGVILQGDGRVINGPLMGTVFKTGPLLDTTWSHWKRLHPDTTVMSPDTPYSKFYLPKGKQEPRGYTSFPAPFFRPSVTRGDLRLPPFDKVLAVTIPADGGGTPLRRAYPIKSLTEANGVVNERVGSIGLAVFFDSESISATAVSSQLDGKSLTFESRKAESGSGKSQIFDKETGTRWSIEGLGEEGPLAGKSLERMDCHLSQWYGWSAYFPDTTIFGRSDPPKPGDPFPAVPAAAADSSKSPGKP